MVVKSSEKGRIVKKSCRVLSEMLDGRCKFQKNKYKTVMSGIREERVTLPSETHKKHGESTSKFGHSPSRTVVGLYYIVPASRLEDFCRILVERLRVHTIGVGTSCKAEG